MRYSQLTWENGGRPACTPAGQIALVVAADGTAIPAERILGKVVECDSFQDARKFLQANGERGRLRGCSRLLCRYSRCGCQRKGVQARRFSGTGTYGSVGHAAFPWEAPDQPAYHEDRIGFHHQHRLELGDTYGGSSVLCQTLTDHRPVARWLQLHPG